jgi:hypothetical protein
MAPSASALATWASVVQAVIGVLGFGFVFWQLTNLRRSIQGATQDRLYAHYTEICKLFLEKPYLRPFFYDNENKPASSPRDHPALSAEIDAMSEMILGLIEHTVVQHVNLPPDSWEHCWYPYARERVKKSQIIKKFYEENKKWYAGALHRQIDRMLKDIAKEERKGSPA